jgi:uncharacterized protein involved in response to NO
MNKAANEVTEKIPAFLQLAFRPFFMSGVLFSILAIILWASTLNGWLSFKPYSNSYWWHSHEMLFGFVVAIIIGFLLTAVQAWTGQPSLKGKPLLALWLLWLSARVLLAVELGFAPLIIVIVDLLFLPVAALCMAQLVIKAKLWRNLFFIPLLLLMAFANGLMHWGAWYNDAELVSQGSYTMVMLVTLIMAVMAGRVFPMFTANGTATQKVIPIRALELLTIISTFLVVLMFMSGLEIAPMTKTILLLLAAVCHLFRCLRWRFLVTLKTPLVWSLHLSYFCIPIGLFLMAWHFHGGNISLSSAMHALTVGAMGNMVLSMISRVSLGHSGRLLVVGWVMSLAFATIFAAFLVRVFGLFLIQDYLLLIAIAAGLWVIAYGLFVVKYWNVLSKPRIDGRLG